MPLNPISLILFTQIIIKGWHNYSIKNKAQAQAQSNRKKNAKKNDPYDSLNNSCASDLAEAEFQKMPNERKAVMRRGGLLENRGVNTNKNFCEFRPTPNMVAAYGEGKKAKHKVSIMGRKSRGSG